MSGFHGGFLIWDELEKIVEEKCVKMPKIKNFWAKTRRVYWYQRSGIDTGMQWAIGTGTAQTGTGTDWQWITCTGTGQSGTRTGSSSSPVFAYFAPLSPVFIHRLFRDPKKRLMGVQIRMRLSEKCTVPRCLGNIRLV